MDAKGYGTVKKTTDVVRWRPLCAVLYAVNNIALSRQGRFVIASETAVVFRVSFLIFPEAWSKKETSKLRSDWIDATQTMI
jgi:hypothetical protein